MGIMRNPGNPVESMEIMGNREIPTNSRKNQHSNGESEESTHSDTFLTFLQFLPPDLHSPKEITTPRGILEIPEKAWKS